MILYIFQSFALLQEVRRARVFQRMHVAFLRMVVSRRRRIDGGLLADGVGAPTIFAAIRDASRSRSLGFRFAGLALISVSGQWSVVRLIFDSLLASMPATH
jgi:hypothetical protein